MEFHKHGSTSTSVFLHHALLSPFVLLKHFCILASLPAQSPPQKAAAANSPQQIADSPVRLVGQCFLVMLPKVEQPSNFEKLVKLNFIVRDHRVQ